MAPLKVERLATTGRIVKVEYTGPNSGKLEFFTKTDPFILPKIDGKEIDLELEFTYRSPYMENKAGADLITIRFQEKRWDYDFARKTVTPN